MERRPLHRSQGLHPHTDARRLASLGRARPRADERPAPGGARGGETSIRKVWPWQWTVAGVLALLVFGAHVTVRYWLPGVMTRLFGEVPDLAQAPSAMIVLVGGYVVLSWLGGTQIARWIGDGQCAREQARWAQEEAMRRRLWAMEQQVREEQLSEGERERQRRYRQQQAEIRREARRRLGLPEEESDG
jgi:hypothetical protein